MILASIDFTKITNRRLDIVCVSLDLEMYVLQKRWLVSNQYAYMIACDFHYKLKKLLLSIANKMALLLLLFLPVL